MRQKAPKVLAIIMTVMIIFQALPLSVFAVVDEEVSAIVEPIDATEENEEDEVVAPNNESVVEGEKPATNEQPAKNEEVVKDTPTPTPSPVSQPEVLEDKTVVKDNDDAKLAPKIEQRSMISATTTGMVNVKVTLKHGENNLPKEDGSIVFSNAQGMTVGSFGGGEIVLPTGTYTFEANIPDYNKKATGSFVVEIPEEGETQQEFSLTFPDGEYWLDGVSFGSAIRVPSIEYDALDGDILKFPIFDNVTSTSAYIGLNWAVPPTGFESSERVAVVSYLPINSATPRNVTVAATSTLASPATTLSNFIPTNGASRVASLTATLKDTSTQIEYTQEYRIDVVRPRTLANLQLKQKSGYSPLSPAFAPTTYDYTANVLDSNETIEILPTAFTSYENGYQVYVNNQLVTEGSAVEIPLAPSGETQADIKVQVRHEDGTTSQEYTIKPELVPICEHKVIIPRGATLDVRNEVDNVADYVGMTRTGQYDTYTFELTTGIEYHYVVTQDEYYTTSGKFVASANGEENITVDTNDYINKIAMSQNASSAIFAGFTEEEMVTNEIRGIVDDSLSGQATLRIGFKDDVILTSQAVTINYCWQTTTAPSDGSLQTVKPNVSREISASLSGMFANGGGGRGQNVDVTISQTEGSIVREQRYNMTLTRRLNLRMAPAPSFTYDGFKATYAPAFNRDVHSDYEMVVPANTTRMVVMAGQNTTVQSEEFETPYKMFINGIQASKSDVYTNTSPMLKAEVLLNGTAAEEEIEIVLNNDYGGTGKYTFKVKKSDTFKMGFETTPSDATLVIADEANIRVWPDNDNKYELMLGKTYKYSLNKYGYVGITGEFVADKAVANMKLELELAEVNEEIVDDIDVEWDKFRGEDNAGTTERMTPATAEEAQLHWAYKSVGASNVGQPLVLDDYVAIMAGNRLQYLDSISGELVAEGLMIEGGGVIATYASGMVFTPLNNGGLQAFNATPRPQTEADTGYTNKEIMVIDSLWTYRDPLRGQGVNPFFVENGYIYGGWRIDNGPAGFVCISITDEDPTKTNEEKVPTWRWERGNGFYWAGAHVSEDFVVVGGERYNSNDITCLDAKTGEVLDTVKNVFTSDNRGGVSYDKTTGRYCLVTRDSFYTVKVDENGKFRDLKSSSIGGASTSTPTVYDGRAYIGYSGTGQFQSFTGSGIMVLDIETAQPIYVTRTQGGAQSSGLLSTAYLDAPHMNPQTGKIETGFVYVYFTENLSPGSISYIIDKPGMTAPALTTNVAGIDVAPRLFEPRGDHSQYNLSSLQVDKYGTLFMKTDKNYIMAIGQKIDAIEVKAPPSKTVYLPGELFDPSGMNVILKFANGQEREIGDYVTVDDAVLTLGQNTINVIYQYALYNNNTPVDYIDSNPNTTFDKITRPTAPVSIVVMNDQQGWSVDEVIGKINDIGEVKYESGIDTKIRVARATYNSLEATIRPAIKNYSTLIAAEERYELLGLASANKLPATQVVKSLSNVNVDTYGPIALRTDDQKILEAITLNIDELLAVEKGENINITVSATVLNRVPATEEFYVDSALQKNNLKSSGYILDITFNKKVGENARATVSELLGNAQIALDIPVPNEYREGGRSFYMVNVHNNDTHILKNEDEANGSRVQITSGKFSTYVLAYAWLEPDDNSSGNSNTGNNNTGNNNAGNNNTGNNSTGNNNTGNNTTGNNNNTNNGTGSNNAGNNSTGNNNTGGNNNNGNSGNNSGNDNGAGSNDNNYTSSGGNNNRTANSSNTGGATTTPTPTGGATNGNKNATSNNKDATASNENTDAGGEEFTPEELEDMSATNEITQASAMNAGNKTIGEADILDTGNNKSSSNRALTIILWGTGIAALATAGVAAGIYYIKKKKKNAINGG